MSSALRVYHLCDHAKKLSRNIQKNVSLNSKDLMKVKNTQNDITRLDDAAKSP